MYILACCILAFVYFLYFTINAPVIIASLMGRFDDQIWQGYLNRFSERVPHLDSGTVARVVASSLVSAFGLLLLHMYFENRTTCEAAWLVLPEGVLLSAQGMLFSLFDRARDISHGIARRFPVLFLWMLTWPKIMAMGGVVAVHFQ